MREIVGHKSKKSRQITQQTDRNNIVTSIQQKIKINIKKQSQKKQLNNRNNTKPKERNT